MKVWRCFGGQKPSKTRNIGKKVPVPLNRGDKKWCVNLYYKTMDVSNAGRLAAGERIRGSSATTTMNISGYSVQHNPGYSVQSIPGYSVQWNPGYSVQLFGAYFDVFCVFDGTVSTG
jgi:hypothetical protein